MLTLLDSSTSEISQIQKDKNMQKPPRPKQPGTTKPGVLEITTPIEIVGVAPDHITPPPRTSNRMQPGPFGRGGGTYWQNRDTITATTQALVQEYQIYTTQLPQSIETELAATRLEGPTDPLPPLPAITREMEVNNKLIHRKNLEFQSKTAIANAFYGGDPFNRHINEFMVAATKIEKWPGPNGIAMQSLNQSLRAAHDVRLLNQTLLSLDQRSVRLQQFYSSVQTTEQAQLVAEQEAQRLAAEQAQLAAAQEAQRIAAEQTQLAAEQEAQRNAAEQAQLAAEQEAQRIAAEQAQLAAEQEAQRIAAEQARLEAEVQRQAEEKALHEAMEAANAAKGVRPFSVSGAAAASGPVFAVAAGTLAVDAATTLAIRTALRTAATVALTASATAIGTASGVLIVVGVAALVYHALKDNEPYAVSFPLSDLTTFDGDDLHAIGKASGEFDLSVAMGSRTAQSTTEFVVAAADGTTVPGKVPVRLATYDPVLNVYRTDLPDTTSSGMTWTPIVGPGNAPTALPAEQPNVGLYTGATAKALEGRIDQNPQMDLYTFGGVIYVFPNESGIPPQYVVFRDRRDEPGAATGFGEAVSGVWLESAVQGEGAKIPTQIADKLRGREFPNFRAFREALWKATANDDELSKQFRASNINEMKNGRAPFSRKSDRLGGQEKFQLHHVNQVSKDGAVYDIDNIRVVTPEIPFRAS